MPKKQKQKNPDQQLKDLEAKWKRALADYQNLEKRIAAEKSQFVRIANATLIEKLLLILDDLERASSHIKDSGLKMILDEFRSIITAEGIEEIKAKGEEFNPQTMDCADLVEGPNNKVIKIIQKGYYYNGTVLRPAKVQVGTQKVKTKK